MRTEARIKTAIWDNQDFVRLRDRPRLAYLFLISQRDINLCGVIAYRPTRWTSRLGCTTEELEDALTQLQAGRFLLVDEEEEELWIRTFMRHDHVKGDRLLGAARDAFAAVTSTKIRAAFPKPGSTGRVGAWE